MRNEDKFFPKMPVWWWAVFAIGILFWLAVGYAALHFVLKWW